MKVDVYKNLNKGCLSVRSREAGLRYRCVVAHKQKVHVRDPTFVVQDTGRQRCRETGSRNVHAFVRGKWDESENVICGEPVTYDPFQYEQFVHAESGETVVRAEFAAVTTEGVFAKGLTYADDNE